MPRCIYQFHGGGVGIEVYFGLKMSLIGYFLIKFYKTKLIFIFLLEDCGITQLVLNWVKLGYDYHLQEKPKSGMNIAAKILNKIPAN